MDERPSRSPLVIGALLGLCGWAVIFLGWYQAGRQDLETGQLPYVISGGFGGFGLLLMGGIAVLIDFVRQSEWKLRRSAEDLHGRMEELATMFVSQQQERSRPSRRTQTPAASSTDAEGPARPRRRRRRRKPSGSSSEGRDA